MKAVGCIFLVCALFTSVGYSQVLFEEQSQLLGCDNSSYGEGTFGGGISFFDFDNDGWDDITISSENGQPVRFFKNYEGSFLEVNFSLADPQTETKTVLWVDIDNDSDFDLFMVSNMLTYYLFENDGNMQFTDITASAGLDVGDYDAWSGSWGDYNNDGWLDLYIGSRNLDNANVHNRLFRNNGNNTFTDVTVAAGLSTGHYLTLCTVFFDYNNDGWQDIYMANDRTWNLNQLYKNNGDGTFSDVSAVSGTNIGISAMSNGIGDYNRDGWLDIYVTNTTDGNVFLRNNGDGTFTDIAVESGTLMESFAWGAVFLDAENDKDLDLYVSSSLTDSQSTYLTAAFYENNGSGFFTIPDDAGFENDVAKSFSNAIGDVTNDGYPDIIVLNYEPDDMYVWHNLSPQDNNWIKIKLEGVESNRQGIGSWVEISVNGEKQYNYTLCGEGYLGQNSAYEFFGIGSATSIDYVKVTWLSGTVDIINNPDINIHGTLVEGSNTLTVEDSFLDKDIRIFPNPSDGNYTIQLPQTAEGATLHILDIQGRELDVRTLQSLSNQINISSFATGIYFFKIQKGFTQSVKKILLKK